MGLLIAVTVPVLLGVLSSVIAGDRVCRWFCGLCLLLLLWPLSAITALEFVCSYCWDLCMQLLLGPVYAVTAVVLSVVIAGDWVYSWLLLLWLLSAITALEFVCRYCWVCEVFLQLLLWLMSVVTLLWRMSAVTAGIFCTGSFGPFFCSYSWLFGSWLVVGSTVICYFCSIITSLHVSYGICYAAIGLEIAQLAQILQLYS